MKLPEILEGGTPALVVAHPGHELLLHHWMELCHPLVFTLTDGSGSRGESRTAHSARIVSTVGGTLGSVFGEAPDREWYAAIVRGDCLFFRRIAQRISAECVEHGVDYLVTDSVEYFNPMHDLCAALAGAVARCIATATGREVGLFDYAIKRTDSDPVQASAVIHLDRDALERKRAAAASIPPLAGEVARHGEREAHARECLRTVPASRAWPPRAPDEPFYERVGRRRIAEGCYGALITYEEHVRPLALDLGG